MRTKNLVGAENESPHERSTYHSHKFAVTIFYYNYCNIKLLIYEIIEQFISKKTMGYHKSLHDYWSAH